MNLLWLLMLLVAGVDAQATGTYQDNSEALENNTTAIVLISLLGFLFVVSFLLACGKALARGSSVSPLPSLPRSPSTSYTYENIGNF